MNLMEDVKELVHVQSCDPAFTKGLISTSGALHQRHVTVLRANAKPALDGAAAPNSPVLSTLEVPIFFFFVIHYILSYSIS